MREVVFLRPPGDPRLDFWRLVDLAGYTIVDNPRPTTERLYVTLDPDSPLTQRLAAVRAANACSAVWWNLTSDLAAASDDERRRALARVSAAVDEVWVADRSYAMMSSMFRFVPLGGHAEFCIDDIRRVSWDVGFYGPRDATIEKSLRDKGLRVLPEGGPLRRTKIMLSPHAYPDAPVIEPMRAVMAACHHMAFVTMPLADPGHLVRSVDYVEHVDVALMAKLLCTGHPGIPGLDVLSENLHEMLVEDLTFRVNIEQAVADMAAEEHMS